MANVDLAVIMTTYQMPGHLRRALESIACQRTRRRIEVVVADDGSTDETPQVVNQFAASVRFPVRFVTHPHAGFHPARCRNEGVRQTTAPHLLFCDGDCLLPPGHIEAHMERYRPGTATCGFCVRLDEASSTGVTVETVRRGEFTKLAAEDELAKLTAMHRKFWWYNLVGHRSKPALKSTDFSISRADYERINGFDEQFRGWGCEDDDLGRRLKAAGVRLVSVLDATRLYHLWHPPAPSKPTTWREGANVAYLGRPLRTTRCLDGLAKRTTRELTVRLAGEPADRRAFDRLLKRHGWRVEFDPQVRADLELLPWPGTGNFADRGDCRVLVVLDDSRCLPWRAGKAHVVLSPSGRLGNANQARLRLDDAALLWRVLFGEPVSAPTGLSLPLVAEAA
jgi:glycosyltransferase involved in cell wall biosynthesis